jgi:hypothetical protein
MAICDFPDQCLPAIFSMIFQDTPAFYHLFIYPGFVVVVCPFLGAGTIVMNSTPQNI